MYFYNNHDENLVCFVGKTLEPKKAVKLDVTNSQADAIINHTHNIEIVDQKFIDDNNIEVINKIEIDGTEEQVNGEAITEQTINENLEDRKSVKQKVTFKPKIVTGTKTGNEITFDDNISNLGTNPNSLLKADKV